jgi:hypothetical protein
MLAVGVAAGVAVLQSCRWSSWSWMLLLPGGVAGRRRSCRASVVLLPLPMSPALVVFGGPAGRCCRWSLSLRLLVSFRKDISNTPDSGVPGPACCRVSSSWGAAGRGCWGRRWFGGSSCLAGVDAAWCLAAWGPACWWQVACWSSPMLPGCCRWSRAVVWLAGRAGWLLGFWRASGWLVAGVLAGFVAAGPAVRRCCRKGTQSDCLPLLLFVDAAGCWVGSAVSCWRKGGALGALPLGCRLWGRLLGCRRWLLCHLKCQPDCGSTVHCLRK